MAGIRTGVTTPLGNGKPKRSGKIHKYKIKHHQLKDNSLNDHKPYRCAVQLLKAGADPSLIVDGVSPLHLAAGLNSSLSFHFTRLFLGHGADPNVRSVDGLTPVHVAAMWGRIECLKVRRF